MVTKDINYVGPNNSDSQHYYVTQNNKTSFIMYTWLYLTSQ